MYGSNSNNIYSSSSYSIRNRYERPLSTQPIFTSSGSTPSTPELSSSDRVDSARSGVSRVLESAAKLYSDLSAIRTRISATLGKIVEAKNINVDSMRSALDEAEAVLKDLRSDQNTVANLESMKSGIKSANSAAEGLFELDSEGKGIAENSSSSVKKSINFSSILVSNIQDKYLAIYKLINVTLDNIRLSKETNDAAEIVSSIEFTEKSFRLLLAQDNNHTIINMALALS